jgi:hypothetical protein
LETGKIANLTVVRGDLFAADARVTTVYVDGRPQTITAPTVAGGPGGQGGPRRPGFEGEWMVQVELDGVEHATMLTLTASDDRLVGRLEGDFGSNEVTDFVIGDDGSVTFRATLTMKETTEEARFRGTLAEGVLAGTLEIIGHESGRFAALRSASTTGRARERQER